MAKIARIAPTDLRRTTAPDPLRMPERNSTLGNLAALATDMTATARSNVDGFVRASLPADFVAR
jgi:hypothetical protein